MSEPLLSITDLVMDYPTPDGVFRALDHVSFDVEAGTTMAVVGESGCGKSTLAKSIVRLLTPTSGRICIDGVDISRMSAKALRPYRSRIQMVFQDPYGSLDPHHTAVDIVGEPLRLRGIRSRRDRERRAAELIDQVGLPSTALRRKPAEFSGGQRQRIGIARALASEPELLVCDEATSALDVSVQAQVLDLLRYIKRQRPITYLFISHNLGVVREISDRVVVMRSGQLVEIGDTAAVLTDPAAQYTRELRNAALDPTTMVGIKPRHLVSRLQAATADAEIQGVPA
ncbi:dipeptide/oligopeptide/nickel ABC transporter ATP-binding protein [Gordonia sp. i37]|uniref:ATP-binding cassette domain-containing protein n=1 Tax=Gordonia sp. i37 TaxID=1961707 RepID=UPI0009AC4293|nr:dipeptide/oligopeptide/nickel ABC transporter ATP-binding protein [Gordonia sp. i37]OPX10002.1 ABC transporter ATP-binding protein [Gordonia sp. i37]